MTTDEQIRTLESYIGIERESDDITTVNTTDARIRLSYAPLNKALRRVLASPCDQRQYVLDPMAEYPSVEPSAGFNLSDPIHHIGWLIADIPPTDGKPRITFVYQNDEFLEAIVKKDADTSWLRQFRFEELLTRPIRGKYLHLETMDAPEVNVVRLVGSGQGSTLHIDTSTQKAYDTFGVETKIDNIDPEDDENPARFLLPEYRKTTETALSLISSRLSGGILDKKLVPKLSRNLCWTLRDDRGKPLYFVKLIDSEQRARMECDALRALAGQNAFLQPMFDVMPVTEGRVTLWAIIYHYMPNAAMNTYEKVRQVALIHGQQQLTYLRGFGAWREHPVAQILKDVQDEKVIQVIKSLGPEYEAACERIKKGARCPTHTDAKDDNFHGGRLVDLEAIRHGHPAIDYGMIGLQDGRIDAEDSEAFAYELKRLAKTNKNIIPPTPQELEDGAIVSSYKEVGGLHSRSSSFSWNSLRRSQNQGLMHYLAGVAVKKKIIDRNPFLNH